MSDAWVYAYGVAVLHDQNHPNAMKFADWYEDNLAVPGWSKISPVKAWFLWKS